MRCRRSSSRSRRVARALATLDALAALAERAKRSGWCRPQFVRDPCIEIERGRHPVVEARLQERGAAVHRQRLPARCESAGCW